MAWDLNRQIQIRAGAERTGQVSPARLSSPASVRLRFIPKRFSQKSDRHSRRQRPAYVSQDRGDSNGSRHSQSCTCRFHHRLLE